MATPNPASESPSGEGIRNVPSLCLQTVEAARADAERIKRIGEAEAYSVEAVGKAEAESMKLKAQAYKQYGEAAIMSMVLDSLPQEKSYARAVLSPYL
ncbi:Flotillin-2 [Portunus trituberculatus]|uniref:Flotillin-2 n=1 Tax=Portunus trituberculatus TaxID=210409 RepID=A0A5B7FPG3_PORTR|nr:Flotillin-2 [Portunus trituberculatus]